VRFRSARASLESVHKISLLEKQNGVCAICDRVDSNRSLSIDHDHTTKIIRGLLCTRCNRVLGQIYDDIDLLKRAIMYLENPPGNGMNLKLLPWRSIHEALSDPETKRKRIETQKKTFSQPRYKKLKSDLMKEVYASGKRDQSAIVRKSWENSTRMEKCKFCVICQKQFSGHGLRKFCSDKCKLSSYKKVNYEN
jgi:hypothetical protein